MCFGLPWIKIYYVPFLANANWSASHSFDCTRRVNDLYVPYKNERLAAFHPKLNWPRSGSTDIRVERTTCKCWRTRAASQVAAAAKNSLMNKCKRGALPRDLNTKHGKGFGGLLQTQCWACTKSFNMFCTTTTTHTQLNQLRYAASHVSTHRPTVVPIAC